MSQIYYAVVHTYWCDNISCRPMYLISPNNYVDCINSSTFTAVLHPTKYTQFYMIDPAAVI